MPRVRLGKHNEAVVQISAEVAAESWAAEVWGHRRRCFEGLAQELLHVGSRPVIELGLERGIAFGIEPAGDSLDGKAQLAQRGSAAARQRGVARSWSR